MKQLSWVAVAAFAALLVVGGSASALVVKDECEGKVVAFEKGKMIEVEVKGEKKSIKLDDKTEMKGEVAVGKNVKVTAKEGVATMVEVKE